MSIVADRSAVKQKRGQRGAHNRSSSAQDHEWNADDALAQRFASKSTYLIDSESTSTALKAFGESNVQIIHQTDTVYKQYFEHWFLQLQYALCVN
jgi:hypothetical protein